MLAQILERSTGKVLDNQITPIEVTLDGRTHPQGGSIAFSKVRVTVPLVTPGK